LNYASGRNSFKLACDTLSMNPLPASDVEAVDTLLRFVAWGSAYRSLRASTLSQYVAAVRHMWHRSILRRDPSAGSPLVSSYLSAVQATDKRPALFRHPFPPDWLPHACARSPDPVIKLAFLIGFSFFLRVSEYCSTPEHGSVLRRRHLFVRNGCLVLDIPHSKTDKVRRGSWHQRQGTGGTLCPVTAYLEYAAAHPDAPPDSVGLVWLDGRPLSAARFNLIIKEVANFFGADESLYSSHALRSGGVTAFSRAGAPVDLCIREGRWSSIAGLLKYLRLDSSAAAGYTAGMLEGGGAPAALAPRPPLDVIAPR